MSDIAHTVNVNFKLDEEVKKEWKDRAVVAPRSRRRRSAPPSAPGGVRHYPGSVLGADRPGLLVHIHTGI